MIRRVLPGVPGGIPPLEVGRGELPLLQLQRPHPQVQVQSLHGEALKRSSCRASSRAPARRPASRRPVLGAVGKPVVVPSIPMKVRHRTAVAREAKKAVSQADGVDRGTREGRGRGWGRRRERTRRPPEVPQSRPGAGAGQSPTGLAGRGGPCGFLPSPAPQWAPAASEHPPQRLPPRRRTRPAPGGWSGRPPSGGTTPGAGPTRVTDP